MARSREKTLVIADATDHDIGQHCQDFAELVDAGWTLSNPHDRRLLRTVLYEASARLHKDYPGNKPT